MTARYDPLSGHNFAMEVRAAVEIAWLERDWKRTFGMMEAVF